MKDEPQLPSTELAPQMDLGQMFSGMIDLAKDPEVDPSKMEAILSMQERMLDRQALVEFNKAMHRARSKMPRISKDGAIKNKNGAVQSRYAHYEAIDAIVRPIVEAEGLTYGFNYSQGQNGVLLVTCIVSHTQGHTADFGPMPLALDTSGSKNATQGAGSSGKYGQRYTLCAAFNIVTEGADDDGNQGRQIAAPAKGFGSLLGDAQKAASQGSQGYTAFFTGLTNMQKGWLIDEGHHTSLKASAAEFD